MAPGKRRRANEVNEDEDEDEVEVETASSSQRRSLSKRPRLSLAAENGGSVVSDEEEEVDGNPEQPVDFDEGEFDSDNEDAAVDEMRASQYIVKQMRTHADNMPSECGIIEEVFCRNFMCHSKLRIKLGPLINFIIGHNGSGKSAVLTALTICLGVKATATNRAASLKAFIKEGEESAMLSVRIKNQGDLAYHPDIYGQSIIVERHFNRAGTSSFKIKNADERVVTTKRADLEDMLDYLALQLDNPMNVLSQDLARAFLSNSTPRDKYKFFLRGTQLEQLDRDYRMMEQFVDQIETKLARREDDMAVLKQRAQEAEAKKKLVEQSQSIREKISHLQWMHAWAQVEQVETQLRQAEDKIRQTEERVDVRKREYQEKSDIYDHDNGTFEAATLVKGDLEAELAPARDKHASIKEQFDKQKADLVENTTQRRRIQSDLKNVNDEIAKSKGLITEEEARIEESQGGAQALKIAQLDEAKAALELRMGEETDLDKSSLSRALVDAERTASDRREDTKGPRQRQEGAETRLRSLRDRADQQMAAFQHNVPNLLRAIQNEGRFREKPVGPMAMHIRLRKPEWSSIVESWLGGVLESFVVTSKYDQGILSELMRRMNCVSDIYIGKPGRVDVSRYEPSQERDTILRILEIDNDLVRNQLIINNKIEQVVLIKDRTEATNFFYPKNGPLPLNTTFTVCFTPSDRNSGLRLGRSRAGKMSTGPVRAWTRRARMKTDVDAQVRMLQESVDQAKRDLDTAQSSVREADMEVKRAKEALNRFDRQQRDRRIARQEAETRVDELRDQIEQSTIETGRLDALKAQLRDSEESQKQQQSSYQDAIISKENLNTAQREVKDALDEATKEVTERETRIKKVETTLRKQSEKRSKALQDKNLAEGFVGVATKEKEDAERDAEKKRAEVVDFTREAAQVHERIPVERGLTADMIDKRLDRLHEDHKRAESRAGGSREEVYNAWAQATKDYRTATKDLNKLQAVSNHLTRACIRRKWRWKAFRKYITARAKFMFIYLLSERAFRGRIIVDHAEMAMDISVEPDMAKTSDKGRQSKTLSGGEKSFATICLLLSIWEAMGSPIRCLDEFDVFMDNVNRDISMRMMIGAARRSVGRQFILITPQAMGNVQLGADVKIHKMTDPERGQTTLPFGE